MWGVFLRKMQVHKVKRKLNIRDVGLLHWGVYKVKKSESKFKAGAHKLNYGVTWRKNNMLTLIENRGGAWMNCCGAWIKI